jgi:hypothetical protein
MKNRTLRIIVTAEGDMLVAQCLEHDISVQAPDMDTLQRRFEAALILESSEGDLEAIPPAPKEFHVLWKSGNQTESLVDNAETRLAA